MLPLLKKTKYKVLIDICLKFSSMISAFITAIYQAISVSIFYVFNKIYTKLHYNLDVMFLSCLRLDG